MKLQKIVAAVAILAAGAANAAIEKGTNGNGSLFLLAFDNLSAGTFSTTAGLFDLGYSLNDFASPTGHGTSAILGDLTASGTTVVWDFTTNTIKKNGAVVSTLGGNDWTAAFTTLIANADAGDIRFAVGANDTVGFGTAKRSLFTGSQTPSAAQLLAQNNVNTGNMAIISVGNDIFTPIANKGTMASASNGAYTFTAADGATTRANGYAVAGDGFANEWRNANKMNGVVLAGETNGFWLGDGTGNEQMLGTMSLNVAARTLTFTAPGALVPEPSTYALVFAGLASLAFARRRA